MNNITGILIFILASFLTSIAHLILKKNIADKDKNKRFLNKNLIFAGSLFSLVTLVTIFGYKFIDLKYGIILSTTSYLFIIILSKEILKESISNRSKIGSILILFGILVFSFN